MPRSRRSPRQRYHDRVAGQYEQIYSDAYWQWHDGLTWDYLKPHLPRDLSLPVADLGCGTGKWGCKLIKSGYRVTFVDVSIKMVEQARRQVEAMGAGHKAEFLQADLMDLSQLPADHFMLAVAMGEPLCSTERPAAALSQIHRCLRPGGLLVATFDNRIACVDFYLDKGNVTELEGFLRTGRTRWLTRDPSEQFEMITFTPQQLGRTLTAAGFGIIEMIGKTVLPMRRYRQHLEEPAHARRWARLEKKLGRDPENFARCAHLQVTACKGGNG